MALAKDDTLTNGAQKSQDTTPALGQPISQDGMLIGITSTACLPADPTAVMLEVFNCSDVAMFLKIGDNNPQAELNKSVFLAPNGGSYSQATKSGFAAIAQGSVGNKQLTWTRW